MRESRKTGLRARRGSSPRVESLEGRALLTAATFKVVTDWGSGFTGEVRIDNTNPSAIANWKLEFDFAPSITPVWNGAISSHVGTHYTVTGASWNKDIPVGGNVTFGFNATPGNLGASTPSNWILNGVPLNGTTTPPPGPGSLSVDDVSVTEGDPAPPAGTTSGFFTTSGSQIVDSAGKAVKIAGVNWFGFETSNFAPHGLWTRGYKEMMDQMKGLGFNTIRLPYSSQLFDAASKPNGIDFSKNPDLVGLSGLQIMDKIVDYAGQIGLRIMLDHHRSTAGNSAQESGLWYTPEYPEARWISDWTMLAQRYKGNSAVIAADLHNEPHGPATWGSGSATTDWRLAAERAGNAILAVNPDWLIVVEGIEKVGNDNYWWGGNLSAAGQYPVRLNTPGHLVYSPHDYPQSVYNQPWFSAANYPNNLPSVWDQHWGYLFRQNTTPILLGEFGSKLSTTVDKQWAEKLITYLKGDLDGNGTNDLAAGQQGPSWTWWAWNPNSGDTGGILQDDWKTVRTEAVTLLKPIEFALAPPSGGGGASVRYAVFTVSLSQAQTSSVSVGYGTVDGTGKAGVDYQTVSGSLTFAPGETRKTVSVPIIGDSLVESDETFFLRLSGPSNVTIADGEGQATIVNDDGPAPPPATPTIRITGGTVDEGTTGSKPLAFTVSLSAASTSTITVDYATFDGTAKAGSDYLAASGRLTFAPGQTNQTVNISVLGDTVIEPDESFELRLTAPVGATLSSATATGSIRNDDVATPPPSNTKPVKFVVKDDWGAGFVADLTLTNVGTTAWTSWTVAFDLDASITNIWNAEIVSHVGTRYTIRSAAWNGAVAAGGSVTSGFQVATATGKPRTLSNVVLNGKPVT